MIEKGGRHEAVNVREIQRGRCFLLGVILVIAMLPPMKILNKGVAFVSKGAQRPSVEVVSLRLRGAGEGPEMPRPGNVVREAQRHLAASRLHIKIIFQAGIYSILPELVWKDQRIYIGNRNAIIGSSRVHQNTVV